MSSEGKGECTVCGTMVRLQADGLAATHSYPPLTRRVCPGSGLPHRAAFERAYGSLEGETMAKTQEQGEHGSAEEEPADLTELSVSGEPIEQGASDGTEDGEPSGIGHSDTPNEQGLPDHVTKRSKRPRRRKVSK